MQMVKAYPFEGDSTSATPTTLVCLYLSPGVPNQGDRAERRHFPARLVSLHHQLLVLPADSAHLLAPGKPKRAEPQRPPWPGKHGLP